MFGPSAVRTKTTERFTPSNNGLVGFAAGRDELGCREIGGKPLKTKSEVVAALNRAQYRDSSSASTVP